MRKLLSVLGVAAFATLFIVACSKSAKQDVQAEVSQETLNQISALGFSADNVIAADGGYVVEGDIFLSPSDLATKKVTLSLIVPNEEQYHTTNLVSGPRAITISVNGSVNATFSSAVDAAIARYNTENLTLTFSRVASGGDIVIRLVNSRQYIASAGFPSGGDPYGEVKYAKTYTSNTYSKDFMTTVLCHEIGHCIGFRHTDYATRQSCGSNVNEGSAGVGAIYIPGTATGYDATSWMLACMNSATQNRPFNNNDKTALNYLY